MNARRQINDLVKTAGLEVMTIEITGHSHYRANLRRSDGVCANFFFPNTPSDRRWSLNKLSILRRFATGNFNPVRDHGHR